MSGPAWAPPQWHDVVSFQSPITGLPEDTAQVEIAALTATLLAFYGILPVLTRPLPAPP